MANNGPETPQATDGLPRIDPGRSMEYWGNVSADVDGMLGDIPRVDGFSQISRIDLHGSWGFLAKLGFGRKSGRQTVQNALEGGAGIGRVTEGLLLQIAAEVDIIEPVSKFTVALHGKPGIRSIANISMSAWKPSPGIFYDLVWIQWCLGYLTDDEIVAFLRHCSSALRTTNAILVVKENITTGGGDVFDDVDSSFTRGDQTFRRLFKAAGLRVVKAELQKGVPQTSELSLFPIKMYGLKPEVPVQNS